MMTATYPSRCLRAAFATVSLTAALLLAAGLAQCQDKGGGGAPTGKGSDSPANSSVSTNKAGGGQSYGKSQLNPGFGKDSNQPYDKGLTGRSNKQLPVPFAKDQDLPGFNKGIRVDKDVPVNVMKDGLNGGIIVGGKDIFNNGLPLAGKETQTNLRPAKDERNAFMLKPVADTTAKTLNPAKVDRGLDSLGKIGEMPSVIPVQGDKGGKTPSADGGK
jgi:hypothetical protein